MTPAVVGEICGVVLAVCATIGTTIQWMQIRRLQRNAADHARQLAELGGKP